MGLEFDAVYSGYLGSEIQLEHTKDIIKMFKSDDSVVLVDPVMGDRGKLYAGFDDSFAKGMASLCKYADIIVPNITEAAFLTGTSYRHECDEEYIEHLAQETKKLGATHTVITGVSFKKDEVGVAVISGDRVEYIMHKRAEGMYHGTGDVFASVLLSGVMHGFKITDAADLAAEVVIKSIEKTKNTYGSENYGVNFEECIPFLVKKLELGD
jgi:pyridoxine kinase